MYTLKQLKKDKRLWSNLEVVPAKCSWCSVHFEIKNGTLYNIIRRNADGMYCSRRCSGAARAYNTQKKYKESGGKICKRCNEFRPLDMYSTLPNPPYYRAECKRCHNYKPARFYNLEKNKAERAGVPFDLSMDEFAEFENKACYYCNASIDGIRLELVDNSVGYVSSNLVSCCKSCKKFKGCFSHEEFLSYCKKVHLNVKDKEVVNE